jgi:hypothetical protein
MDAVIVIIIVIAVAVAASFVLAAWGRRRLEAAKEDLARAKAGR